MLLEKQLCWHDEEHRHTGLQFVNTTIAEETASYAGSLTAQLVILVGGAVEQ